MISNIDNGDVIAVGPSCVIVFYLTASAEMLTLMPDENVTAYAKVLAPILDRMAELADYDGAAAAEQVTMADLAAVAGALKSPAPDADQAAGEPDSDPEPLAADAAAADA